MKPRIGSVPFLNAKPLVAWFESANEADVVFELPSKLGPMVDRGGLDAAIASSFFAIADPSLRIAGGVSISSFGAVRSVKLFSKTAFENIQTLALDGASMTSNHLALIVLTQIYGVRPETTLMEADLPTMIADRDAAVLIGDAGMAAHIEGLHVMDLGQVWADWTGLPFVWAFWVGRDGLNDGLSQNLHRAKEFGIANLKRIANQAARETGIEAAIALEYLRDAIDFDLDERHLQGFRLFGEKCVEMGFADRFVMPVVVGDTSAKAASS
jgi:chorismate dehydratase